MQFRKSKTIARRLCAMALPLALVAAAAVAAPASAADPPGAGDGGAVELRRPIDNENPFFAPACAIGYEEGTSVEACWNAIPEDLRASGLVGLDLVPHDGISTGQTALGQDKERQYQLLDSWLTEFEAFEDHTFAMYQIAWGPNYLVTEERIEQLYKDHPSFIGVAFTEMHYGNDANTTAGRMARQMVLAHKYGGYTFIDDCADKGVWDTYTVVWAAANLFPENLIMSTKGTAGGQFLDSNSRKMGWWLSGRAGNWGYHPDTFAWQATGRGNVYGGYQSSTGATAALVYPEAQVGNAVLSAAMMGATAFTNFELPAYSFATWGKATPLAKNVVFPIIRQIADGKIKIPSKAEVAASVKVGVIEDVRMNSDQVSAYKVANNNWNQSTGRYHTLAWMPKLLVHDPDSAAVPVTITASEWYAALPTAEARKAWLDENFPEEYTGTLFAERMGNQWLTYNSQIDYESNQYAEIPFQYNSAESMTLTYAGNTLGWITEEDDQLDVFLSNYLTDHTYLWEHRERNCQILWMGVSDSGWFSVVWGFGLVTGSPSLNSVPAQTW
ncbi:MAG: hypothetical protein LBG11_00425, partial [Bifidobacteriaceae bacterium]|nr:hypothetical protein [Bifidobacteriaceae bacterium]